MSVKVLFDSFHFNISPSKILTLAIPCNGKQFRRCQVQDFHLQMFLHHHVQANSCNEKTWEFRHWLHNFKVNLLLFYVQIYWDRFFFNIVFFFGGGLAIFKDIIIILLDNIGYNESLEAERCCASHYWVCFQRGGS